MTGYDAARRPAHSPISPISARRWQWVVLDGVIGVAFGILALAYPNVTAAALGILLGIGLLIQGIIEIWAGVVAWPGTTGRAMMIVVGILVLIAGLICILRPGAGIFAITLGLAIWFLLLGVTDLSLAATGREHRISNLILGIIEVALALVLILDRNAAIATIAIIAGLSFLLRGVLAIYLGWRLRGSAA
jgi:short repeat uncharacterized protein DUF308/putative transmembrane protein PGPGW